MNKPIDLTSDDPILDRLNFKPYRNMVVRRAVPFVPKPDEPQTMDVKTPWGSMLTAKRGDFLVSELDAPNDYWPVDAKIFDETYVVVGPGLCVKRAVTMLVPLSEVTNGDEDRMVVVHTLEGPETVRAGDFFLARGVKGEIWPYPKEKVLAKMRPVEQ
ncbi:MAG: hypothetical protein HND47_09825 [Chloroflexi bacterium]|nr:hypothetical protein [Chloroflexota bacterium]